MGRAGRLQHQNDRGEGLSSPPSRCQASRGSAAAARTAIIAAAEVEGRPSHANRMVGGDAQSSPHVRAPRHLAPILSQHLGWLCIPSVLFARIAPLAGGGGWTMEPTAVMEVCLRVCRGEQIEGVDRRIVVTPFVCSIVSVTYRIRLKGLLSTGWARRGKFHRRSHRT